MKNTRIIMMAAALMLTATVAFGHEGGKGRGDRGGRGGHRGGFMSQRLAEKLNLTDAQKAQIQEISKGFREQNRATFEGSRDLRQEARAARKANDTAKLEALKPQLEAQRTQMQQLREAHQQQILAVLTAEQRAQLETMKSERKQRRGNR
ncbi:MAG TPA: Spy/CpxP family protein refolding chaperone [Thermoanaerobaculia bacterium]|nr:Spy/CpxP family protein refolding chaperone [Thermoanaerobaculia bacterium]